MKIETVENAPRTRLGESPLWFKTTQSLIFVDTLGKTVYNFCPKSGTAVSMTFDQIVGFAVPTSRSKKDQLILLVGLENKIIEIDMSEQQILRTLLMVPEGIYVKGMRFSGAKCSPDGELFAGLMHNKWRDGNRGYLFRVLHGTSPSSSPVPDAAVPKSVLKNVLPKDAIYFPNGTAWLGTDTLFMVDSAENEITRLTFTTSESETATKRVTERKLIFKLPQPSIDLGYLLQGMTIDSKGKLWVALWGAGCILRIDPATGQEVFRLHLDTKKPTACTFGGSDLTDLYITSSNEDTDVADASGELVVARIDGVRGIEGATSVNLDLLSVLEEEPVEFNCMAIFCGLGV